MNLSNQKPIDSKSNSGGLSAFGEFESTLRLIASLPAPEGLEERVKASLTAAPRAAADRARILAWPTALQLENGWWQSSLARSAAAAAIAAVVVGGGWSVYSRVQMNQAQRAIVLPRVAIPGGFSSAGAKRTPQTLNGPMAARPVTAAAQTTKADDKPAQRSVRRGRIAAGKKAASQPAASATK